MTANPVSAATSTKLVVPPTAPPANLQPRSPSLILEEDTEESEEDSVVKTFLQHNQQLLFPPQFGAATLQPTKSVVGAVSNLIDCEVSALGKTTARHQHLIDGVNQNIITSHNLST